MESMVDILLFALQVAFWYFVIGAVVRLLFSKKEKELAVQRDELVDKLTKLIHRIKQEQHGDVYYWFDADTDSFLAQGRTDEEIRKHLLSRFKGHIFFIDDKKVMAGPELKVMSVDQLTVKS